MRTFLFLLSVAVACQAGSIFGKAGYVDGDGLDGGLVLRASGPGISFGIETSTPRDPLISCTTMCYIDFTASFMSLRALGSASVNGYTTWNYQLDASGPVSGIWSGERILHDNSLTPDIFLSNVPIVTRAKFMALVEMGPTICEGFSCGRPIDQFQLEQVPEPHSYWILAGLGTLILMRKAAAK